uniref:BED-type domain-containing protein n=1 Tax=Nicotiana tabacum TaxID=4097 RepID=A0A1S4DLN4_TOBAC|nr:PREDICTED: uncharacterized protein LOC107831102 [Nicotiana tabacum]
MDEEGSINASKIDVAWKYSIMTPDEKYFRCKFCTQQSSGTINRLKQHLAGTHKGIKSCPKVQNEVAEECKKALLKLKNIKIMRKATLEEMRAVATGSGNMDDESGSSPAMGNLPPKARGPLDDFVSAQTRQATLNSKWKKEGGKEVCQRIGRFFFSSGIPFNVANNPYYLSIFERVANYGPGFVTPSMHELRTWILKDEVININKMLDEHKKSWKQYGCSIMSDSWTDGKIIDEVREENVVQIITDNGSNFINAGKRIMETRPHIYWTPYAAHCINLLLEDIGKLKMHQDTLIKAKKVVRFIYGHTWVLDLMRSFTNNRELIRPDVTRFTTAYLTLQSIQKQKQALRSMFSSEAWNKSVWAKKHEEVKTRAIVLFDQKIWPYIAYCVKSVAPLVGVLREVDSEEKSCMGYLYDLIHRAKEKITLNCGYTENKYAPIWKRIDDKWTRQLCRPLHVAGYYLNPQLQFEERFSINFEVKQSLYQCIERMLDYEERFKMDVQLDSYDQFKGDFGCQIAVDSRKVRSPTDWWIRFGGQTPELTKFAIRVLSLTCSSSGCERNWSTFELIHTKKRNRLEHHRLNALVYVRYNTRLRERSIKRKLQKFDPVLVDEVDSDDE